MCVYIFNSYSGQEFFAVEVAANPLVSSSDSCMRLIRQAARALYNDSYPSGMAHLCRLPTQIPMKWWPRETLRAGEVIHILGRLLLFSHLRSYSDSKLQGLSKKDLATQNQLIFL